MSTHPFVLLAQQTQSSASLRSSFRLSGQSHSGSGLTTGTASPGPSQEEPRRHTGRRLARLDSSVAQRSPLSLEPSSSPETGRVEPAGQSRTRERRTSSPPLVRLASSTPGCVSRRPRRSSSTSGPAARGATTRPPLSRRCRPSEVTPVQPVIPGGRVGRIHPPRPASLDVPAEPFQTGPLLPSGVRRSARLPSSQPRPRLTEPPLPPSPLF